MGEQVDALDIAALDLDGGRVVGANARAAALFGSDPVGRVLVEVLAPLAGDGHDRSWWSVAGDDARDVVVEVVGDPSGSDRILLVDRSEQCRLAAMVESLADTTLVLDATARVVWQSQGTTAQMVDAGVAEDDLLGGQAMSRIHPDDLPSVMDAFVTLLAAPGARLSSRVRSRSVVHDDLWQSIELVGSSAVDVDGVRGIIVQVHNLDEGLVVPSIAESVGEFTSLAEGAPIGILVADHLGFELYRNAVARSVLGGVGPGGPGAPAEDWRACAHPDDRPIVDALVAAALAGEGGGPTTIRCPTGGGVRHVRLVMTPRFAADVVVGFIAALEDVTAEVEARAETERLTQMLDATSDYVAVFRPAGEILYVNAVMQGVFDRIVAGGRRGTLRDLLDDDARAAFVADAMVALETSNTWRGELELNVGPNESLPVSALAVVRRDDDGNLDWVAMLARDISELKEAEVRLQRLVDHDSLTGLPNRTLLNRHLEAAVRRGTPAMAVLFCDLDAFKSVNDTHGHAVGDALLVALAERLRGAVRTDDLAARIGGDEFVVVCEGFHDNDALATLAELLVSELSAPVQVGDVEVHVGVSIGAALVAPDAHDISADRLLTLADGAMYRAKATGGNRYRIVDVD